MASLDPSMFPHLSAEHRDVLEQFAEALGEQADIDLPSAPAELQLTRLRMFSNFRSAQRPHGKQVARAQMETTANLITEMLKSVSESRAQSHAP